MLFINTICINQRYGSYGCQSKSIIKLYFFDMTHLDVNMYLKFKVCKYFDSTSMEMLLQVICL